MEVKGFLELLCHGIKEIPKKHHSLFYTLQKMEVITKKEKLFKLKDGFAIGILDVIRKDLIFLKSFSPKHSRDFRVMRGFRGLVSGDIALVKIASKSTRSSFVSLLYSPRQQEIVYLEKIKGKVCALSLKSTQDKPIIYSLKARQKALLALPNHTVLEIDARSGEILDVLGILEDESVDEQIILHRYGRKEEFSQDCLDLAQSFGDRVYKELYPHRKDLTHLPFCTIDPRDAKDHDDAIYFDSQSRTLYVAIADVSEYVSKNSAIDEEAKKRGFSLYLPHKSIPMLPRNLSENICSLKENQERLALVWEMELDSEARVVRSCVYEAVICSQKSLTYEEAEEILDSQNGEVSSEISKSILGFYPLAYKSRENRLKKGYDFLSEESKLNLDEGMSLKSVELRGEGKSHHLVQEAMLLANIESAKMLEKMPVEGMYRIHEEMKEMQIFELLQNVQSMGFSKKTRINDVHFLIQEIQEWAERSGLKKEVDKMIIKAQNQAQYSHQNIGHFGLGFEVYTHFTSPIRRYSDLWVHRVMKEFLKGGKKLEYLAFDAASLCKSLSEMEREVSRAEMEYKDRKFAHWASRHIGEELRASVVDTAYPPLCVALEKINGARIVLAEREAMEYLSECVIRIVEVNLANARIFAEISSNKEQKCPLVLMS